jgi:hypothetical protein
MENKDHHKKYNKSGRGQDARYYKVTDFLNEEKHVKKKVVMVVMGQPIPWPCPMSRKNNLGKIYHHFNLNRSAQDSMKDAFIECLGKEIGRDGCEYFWGRHSNQSSIQVPTC